VINYLRKIYYLLGEGQKKIPLIIFLFVLSSLFDLAGLSLIAPFIGLALDTNVLDGVFGQIVLKIGLSQDKESLLLIISLVLLGVFLVKTLSNILINIIIINFSQSQEVRLRNLLMKSYQSLPYINYLNRNSSEYIHSIHNLTEHYASRLVLPLLRTIGDSIIGLFILGFLAWQNISALLTLTTLIGLLIIAYDRIIRHKVTIHGVNANKSATRMVEGINEGIEGLKEMRILGKKRYFAKIVSDSSAKFSFHNKRVQVLTGVPRYLLELIMITFIVLLVISAMLFGGNLQELIPTLGVFSVAALRLLPSANMLSVGLIDLRHGHDSVNRLYSDVKEFEHFKPEKLEKNSEIPEKEFQRITLDRISFLYPNASQKSLKQISLEIRAGESIGLMGASGSGKTTLIDLLLGLLDSQDGVINYNGKPLNLFMRQWQSQVAYLPQQVFLIDDTLRQNVALEIDADKINEKLLYKALQQSRLMALVDQLPQGIDTVLGERGVRLSGGQRQRVALARAFYHERDILIMDEATSALDNKMEREIVKEIGRLKGKKTIIVIAHRLTTLQHCDRIYELKDGKIVNVGSYKDLVMSHDS
jgi:ATP-binding cassette, subfamily B, bacterial PglK